VANSPDANVAEGAGARFSRSLLGSNARWDLALPVHLATLTVAFFLLLQLNEGQWFFGDEWDFLADRGFAEGKDGLFDPHNEHWSTIPILIYRALFAVFGVRTYLPYVVVLSLTHIATAHLLWRVMRRSDADPWVATSAVAMFLVFGPGADNLLWAFQIGFIAPVGLGLAHVLLVDHGGGFDGRDVAGWGVAAVALMFSGIAVPMVAVAGLVALGRRGPIAFLQTAGPPAVLFSVWFLTVGSTGLEHHAPATESAVALLPAYIWVGVRSSAESIAGSSMGALALVVAVVGGLLAAGVRDRRVPLPPLACAVGAALLFLVTGFGRTSLGVDQANSARYMYIAAALLLPVIVLGLSELGRLLPGLWIVPAGLGLVAAGMVLSELQLHARAQAERDGFIREQILGAAIPERFDGPLLADTPDPRFSPNLQLAELLAMRDSGNLPGTPRPSPAALLQAAAGLQIASRPAAPETAAGGAQILDARKALVSTSSGCLRATGTRPQSEVTLSYAVEAEVGIATDPPIQVQYLLVRDGVITPHAHVVGPAPSVMKLGVPDATIRFVFGQGEALTLCGVEPEQPVL
jgi:hypothetical protein